MTDPATTRTERRARYGIDAPVVPVALGAAAVVFVVAGIVTGDVVFVVIAAIFAIETGVFLYATLRGKFLVWDRLLDGLGLRGDEQVVDLGCGRGAVLIAAARRLHTGTVHGVDIWRSVDQSGNGEKMTLANAEAEGVADRVELHTADLRDLPLPDGCADVVLSSIAIHNLRDPSDRARAINEAIRVLAPQGRLVIADIRATAEYAARLRAAALDDVGVTSAGPGFWFSGPWQGVKVVRATKPAGHPRSASDVTAGS